MAIEYRCTGKSEHAYQYNDGEGGISTNTVITIDFTAESDTDDGGAEFNELWETKPVLTEAGVEAFVGLQVYPQGFTIYIDYRLTDTNATDVIELNGTLYSVLDILDVGVGGDLGISAGDVT